MSHTPGPWAVDAPPKREKAGILMVVAERGGMPGLIVNQGPITPRDMANARLIAAAPELLDALRDMVNVFHGYQGLQCTRARNAIAKATGETP